MLSRRPLIPSHTPDLGALGAAVPRPRLPSVRDPRTARLGFQHSGDYRRSVSPGLGTRF